MRKLWRFALSPEARVEFGSRFVSSAIDRWVAEGRIGEESASVLRARFDESDSASFFGHFGFHLGMSAVIPPGVGTPIKMIARPSWTAFFRARARVELSMARRARRKGAISSGALEQSLKKYDSARRLHNWEAMAFSALPSVGVGAYLIPFFEKDPEIAHLIADQMAFKAFDRNLFNGNLYYSLGVGDSVNSLAGFGKKYLGFKNRARAGWRFVARNNAKTVAIVGIDGSGKSHLAGGLRQALEEKGLSVQLADTPFFENSSSAIARGIGRISRNADEKRRSRGKGTSKMVGVAAAAFFRFARRSSDKAAGRGGVVLFERHPRVDVPVYGSLYSPVLGRFARPAVSVLAGRRLPDAIIHLVVDPQVAHGRVKGRSLEKGEALYAHDSPENLASLQESFSSELEKMRAKGVQVIAIDSSLGKKELLKAAIAGLSKHGVI